MTDLDKLRPYNKIGMAGILSNPPTSLTSHNAGWTLVYKDYLEYHLKKEITVITEKDDWESFDCILFNHGVNYRPGVYNLFGGVSEELLERLQKFYLTSIQGIDTYDLDYMFDCYEFLEKRKLNCKTIRSLGVITPLTEPQEWMIIGDSHAISVYDQGWGVRRYDGKTLHGALKESLSYMVPYQVEKLKLYFGNIDIRHHLMRQDNPVKAVKDLVFEYYLQVRTLFTQREQLKHIDIILPLPLEDESRKIPGTGMYQGTPFCGSLSDRNMIRSVFIREMKKRMLEFEGRLSLRSWGSTYQDENGKLPFDVMEARQSVHLRPAQYPYFRKN